jgi:hypothetical protein
MPPDHSTNTGNTIIRLCSNDIGFDTPPKRQEIINVYILTTTATHLGFTETTDRGSGNFIPIEFPQAWISAPSYDIYPGETLETIELDGTGGDGRSQPLGLMLVNNAYRRPDSTGAATAESETLIVTVGELSLPTETTPDIQVFPIAETLEGPSCSTWEDAGTCSASSTARNEEALVGNESTAFQAIQAIYSAGSIDELSTDDDKKDEVAGTKASVDTVAISNRQGETEDAAATCPEYAAPRSEVLRIPGSTATLTKPEAPSSNATQTFASLTSNSTVDPFSSNSSLPLNITAAPSVAQSMTPSNQTAPPNLLPTPPPSLATPAPTELRPATPRPTGPVASAVVMYESSGSTTNHEQITPFVGGQSAATLHASISFPLLLSCIIASSRLASSFH